MSEQKTCRYCGLPEHVPGTGGFNPSLECCRPAGNQWCDKRYLWRLEKAVRDAGLELPPFPRRKNGSWPEVY